jgi:hypothetical protein
MVVKQGLGGWEKNGAAVAVVVGSEYQVDMAGLNVSQEVNPKQARITSCLPLIDPMGSLYRLLYKLSLLKGYSRMECQLILHQWLLFKLINLLI